MARIMLFGMRIERGRGERPQEVSVHELGLPRQPAQQHPHHDKSAPAHPPFDSRQKRRRRLRGKPGTGDATHGAAVIGAAGSSPRAAAAETERGRSLAAALAREAHQRRSAGEWSDALRCYHRALDFDPDCYEAWVGLSASFLALRDVSRAAGCLEVARTLAVR
jgi:hypothetical protein